MSLEVGLSAKGLSAFGASVHFLDARVLFFPMAEQASFALEQLPAIWAGEIGRHVLGSVVLNDIVEKYQL